MGVHTAQLIQLNNAAVVATAISDPSPVDVLR